MNSYFKSLGTLTGTALACTLMATTAHATDGVVSSEQNLRLRASAHTSSAVITTLSPDTVVDVIGSTQTGDWFKVEHNDQTGYVAAEYLSVGDIDVSVVPDPQPGLILDGPLNIRSTPSTEGSILGKVYEGNLVDVYGAVDGWYRIEQGYVSAEYLNVISQEEAEEIRNAVPDKSDLVNFALSFQGCAYVYGGTTPSGFDCSGFIQYVFRQFGVTVSRTATQQSQNGIAVAKSDLQPGDVVFFQQGGAISHVGLYVGNGDFIHAGMPSTGVHISSLYTDFYIGGYHSARRMM